MRVGGRSVDGRSWPRSGGSGSGSSAVVEVSCYDLCGGFEMEGSVGSGGYSAGHGRGVGRGEGAM